MRKAWRAHQRGAAPTHKIKRSHCYFFFAVVIRKVVRIDSRLHCTEYRHPLKLGGQQWRRREKRKLSRRLRRRRPLGRRSSLRRLRSLISLESKIGSHGPADVGRVVMIALGWPAPVNSRGRRRDGGASFVIALNRCGGEEERRETESRSGQKRSAYLPFSHLADALGVLAVSSQNFHRRRGTCPRRRFSLCRDGMRARP